ncbi:MAG: hypothetical protein UU48_C0009G0013 [Candidatus Uhrbacteria bacterium GW2011_GWF2_41_16]|jgi:hypothetical protein|uniref:Transmembrane protein n=2 Tax=Candidatus Uhriibacteriota TaxID=1752732 RepID=A0A0G0VDL6_9BACT|nr:MAG: hypothetical protein UU35_C0011G0011 [Candidatus Uhrbacteria bacterium GW2011_GWC2_41_11]KKR97741.1 MAG: hypothetical protein UU48_C0009G0013 [Candidatus Uhrbacteria bacterium GW2011_GWF2_41_16]
MFARLFSLILLIGVLIFIPQTVLADAKTGVCTKQIPSNRNVGPFLQNVCLECYDQGNCSVNDILSVIASIGNFILGIIASLVFLMYIIGGIYWLTAGGDKGRVDKGKKYVVGSTFGLLIVLFAYAGITTLKLALESGKIGDQEVIICDGTDATEGKACGLNQKCVKNQCLSLCTIQYSAQEGEFFDQKYCADLSDDEKTGNRETGCIKNLCPGGENIQCCNVPDYLKEHYMQEKGLSDEITT